jgi:2-polyprenyl-6-methoxyphenol hydroxylase-like FAD-dependent oxidoreductase
MMNSWRSSPELAVGKPIKMVILGGGTAGWMAANLFAKHWSADQVSISLIESPSIGIIGVGEGSTPSLKRFFETLGIAETEWMPRCNATYKLNIRFEDWSPASGVKHYSHPFFSQLDVFTQDAFFVNCHTRRLGLDVHVNPEDFFINGLLARQGKLPLAPANFMFDMQYGYHFDSQLLGAFLAEIAQRKGVVIRKETIAQVDRKDNGDVSALLTDRGELIEGDFFVDCSGFASVLMQKTLGVKFQSFKENLFNDSAVVMPTSITQKIPLETHAQALSAGWCWKIPLTNRFGNGYVYSSDFLTKEKAEHEFRRFLGMEDSETECRHLNMRVGQLENHWSHNCLGLGLSQGFIEPLEATALHLVQAAIELFIDHFSAGQFTAQQRAHFNQLIGERFSRVRDYIVAHYKLNTRDDSDYWRANRNNMKLSESLLQLLDVWYRCGDLGQEIHRQTLSSHFGVASWHCLLAGYGAFPPLAKNQPQPQDLQMQGDHYYEQKVAQHLHSWAINFPSANP